MMESEYVGKLSIRAQAKPPKLSLSSLDSNCVPETKNVLLIPVYVSKIMPFNNQSHFVI